MPSLRETVGVYLGYDVKVVGMKPLPNTVSAVVFDCDGLLLDTETCWSRAEAALFARYGHPFGSEQKALLIGRTLEAACENMADYFGRPGSGTQLHTEFVPLLESELARGVQVMPGAAELLDALADRIALGVATNSSRAMLDAVLNSAGLTEYFTVSVTVDEVTYPKPNPQVYMAAFAKLGSSPIEGVALEDSATGVAAVRAAGSYLITVPSQPDSQLDGDYVTATLADPVLIEWARTVRSG